MKRLSIRHSSLLSVMIKKLTLGMVLIFAGAMTWGASHTSTYTSGNFYDGAKVETKSFVTSVLSPLDALDFQSKRVTVLRLSYHYYSDTITSYYGRYYSHTSSTGFRRHNSYVWGATWRGGSCEGDDDIDGQIAFLKYVGETDRAELLTKQNRNTKILHGVGWTIFAGGLVGGLVGECIGLVRNNRQDLDPLSEGYVSKTLGNILIPLGIGLGVSLLSIPFICIDTRKAKITLSAAVNMADAFNEKLYSSYERK